jgi:hypothetical protein
MTEGALPMRVLPILAALLPGGAATAAHAADPPAWVVNSRQAAAQLGSQLAAELAGALETSPVAAISVCRERAPVIAAELAKSTGANVGRTALKLRSPDNAPLAWQRQVLESFTVQVAAGTSPASLEFTETVASGDLLERRWMKPIMTAPLCLACHGQTLDPGVAEALAREYPRDEARGFSAGELRGAFYVIWHEPVAR